MPHLPAREQRFQSLHRAQRIAVPLGRLGIGNQQCRDGHGCGAERHERVGAEPRIMPAPFTLETQCKADDGREP
jgi:hypothetical protein